MLLAMPILSYPTDLCMKLSILLLYLRIFGVERKFRYIIYLFMAVNVFFLFGSTGVAIRLIYLCNIERVRSRPFWSHNYKLVMAQSVFGMVNGFLVLGIPIVRVWRLWLPVRRKAGVIAVFMTGLM